MKSTKNLFLAGIALAIALLTSVQVAAMDIKDDIKYQIKTNKQLIAQCDLTIKMEEKILDSKNPPYKYSLADKQAAQQKINECKQYIIELENDIKRLKEQQ